MVEQSFRTMAVNGPWVWSLVFAREPEPDFEHDLDTSDEPVVLGSPEPANKSPRLGPWILLLILLTVAGGTYLASDPGLLLDLIGQGPPSAPSAPAPPPTAAQPPAGIDPATAPEPPPSTLPITPVPGPSNVPTPLFHEGQRVTVLPDEASPTGSPALTADVDGTRPGPNIRTGAALRVIDAELHDNAWIYSVRTDAGAKGWIAERRLTAK